MKNPIYASCVAACEACARTCQECLGGFAGVAIFEPLRHAVELCQSSAHICSVAAEELKLGSSLLMQICALSAVICQSTAEECRRQGGELWEACAVACQRAAQECHAVATNGRAAVIGGIRAERGALSGAAL